MSAPTICETIEKLQHDLKLLCPGHASIDIKIDAASFRALSAVFGSYVKSGSMEDCRDLDRGVIEWHGVRIHRG